jgi:hypothetical protein
MLRTLLDSDEKNTIYDIFQIVHIMDKYVDWAHIRTDKEVKSVRLNSSTQLPLLFHMHTYRPKLEANSFEVSIVSYPEVMIPFDKTMCDIKEIKTEDDKVLYEPVASAYDYDRWLFYRLFNESNQFFNEESKPNRNNQFIVVLFDTTDEAVLNKSDKENLIVKESIKEEESKLLKETVEKTQELSLEEKNSILSITEQKLKSIHDEKLKKHPELKKKFDLSSSILNDLDKSESEIDTIYKQTYKCFHVNMVEILKYIHSKGIVFHKESDGDAIEFFEHFDWHYNKYVKLWKRMVTAVKEYNKNNEKKGFFPHPSFKESYELYEAFMITSKTMGKYSVLANPSIQFMKDHGWENVLKTDKPQTNNYTPCWRPFFVNKQMIGKTLFSQPWIELIYHHCMCPLSNHSNSYIDMSIHDGLQTLKLRKRKLPYEEYRLTNISHQIILDHVVDDNGFFDTKDSILADKAFYDEQKVRFTSEEKKMTLWENFIATSESVVPKDKLYNQLSNSHKFGVPTGMCKFIVIYTPQKPYLKVISFHCMYKLVGIEIAFRMLETLKFFAAHQGIEKIYFSSDVSDEVKLFYTMLFPQVVGMDIFEYDSEKQEKIEMSEEDKMNSFLNHRVNWIWNIEKGSIIENKKPTGNKVVYKGDRK